MDITELMEIIAELGGRASTEMVFDAYCARHRIVKVYPVKFAIEQTLKNNGIARMPSGEWCEF